MARTHSDYLGINNDLVREIVQGDTSFTEELESTIARMEEGDWNASYDFEHVYDLMDSLGIEDLDHDICVDCFTYFQTYSPKMRKNTAIMNGSVVGAAVVGGVIGTIIKKQQPLLGEILQKAGMSGIFVCGGGQLYFSLTSKQLEETVEPHVEYLMEQAELLDEEVEQLFPRD